MCVLVCTCMTAFGPAPCTGDLSSIANRKPLVYVSTLPNRVSMFRLGLDIFTILKFQLYTTAYWTQLGPITTLACMLILPPLHDIYSRWRLFQKNFKGVNTVWMNGEKVRELDKEIDWWDLRTCCFCSGRWKGGRGRTARSHRKAASTLQRTEPERETCSAPPRPSTHTQNDVKFKLKR